MATHYSVNRLEGTEDKKWETLHQIFSNGPDHLNWIIASTSGVHGTYHNLNELEMDWSFITNNPNRNFERYITILVIHPRMVAMLYGEIYIRNLNDLKWLRKQVTATLNNIHESQQHNTTQNNSYHEL